MKRTSILLLTLLCSMSIKAQWSMGASVGYDYNIYDFDTKWATRIDYIGRNGVLVDIPVSYRINNHIELGSGLFYQQKGFLQCRYTTYGCNYCLRRDGYVGLPLVGRFSYGANRILLFCEVGGYASYWTNSYFNGWETSPNLHYIDINQEREFTIMDNRFEFGLVSGLGIQCIINEYLSWTSSIRYYHSLTSQLKQTSTVLSFPAYNRTITLQMGLLINIKY